MDAMIYCLVDAGGKVYVKDGAQSHADVAADFGLDEHACEAYRFDLATRRLLRDRGDGANDRAARTHVLQYVGTPEKLMTFAAAGRLPKRVLLRLLAVGSRQPYLDACAVVEKTYTDDCARQNDPCLESGCAVEGEICLQPLLRAGIDYQAACAAEWVKFFANVGNRVDAWKH